MVCSRSPDAGYATPLALVVSLAVAVVASAMVARNVMLLRQVRADLAQAQAEHGLDGAHLEAAAAIIRSGAGPAFRWALASEAGWTLVRAESEREKLSPAAAAGLPTTVFRAFGVADPAALKTSLASAKVVDVGDLDPAPLWKGCAGSLVSGVGVRTGGPAPAYQEPRSDGEDPAWRVGELWRIQVTTAAGWRDTRIVRFTGDARHPVAVVARRLSRGDGGEDRCDAVLSAAA